MSIEPCLSVCLLAGVEHLLRDVKDATISTLSSDVSAKLQALQGLQSRLVEIQQYLEAVLGGKIPINHDILTHLQVRMNLRCSPAVESPFRMTCQQQRNSSATGGVWLIRVNTVQGMHGLLGCFCAWPWVWARVAPGRSCCARL